MCHEAHEPLLLLPTQRSARVEIREQLSCARYDTLDALYPEGLVLRADRVLGPHAPVIVVALAIELAKVPLAQPHLDLRSLRRPRRHTRTLRRLVHSPRRLQRALEVAGD